MLRQTVWALGILLVVAAPLGSANADNAPAMIYVELRPVSPTIKPGSFSASVRRVWRSGERYLRLEEAPDPEQRMHNVLIVNEPDVWMWNRFDNTARHVVDPGPTYVAHARLFPERPSKFLRGLEIGEEKRFFAENDAQQLPDWNIDGIDCTVQSLGLDDTVVTLYLRRSNGLPVQVSITSPGGDQAIRYEKYETGMRFDSSLFSPPKEATMSEAPARR